MFVNVHLLVMHAWIFILQGLMACKYVLYVSIAIQNEEGWSRRSFKIDHATHHARCEGLISLKEHVRHTCVIQKVGFRYISGGSACFQPISPQS